MEEKEEEEHDSEYEPNAEEVMKETKVDEELEK